VGGAALFLRKVCEGPDKSPPGGGGHYLKLCVMCLNTWVVEGCLERSYC